MICKFKIFMIYFFIVKFSSIHAQNCDTVTTPSINDLYQNTVLNHLNNYINASSMLNQIIKFDSTFVNAYFLLGELNYNKLQENNFETENKNSENYKNIALQNLTKTSEKCPEYMNFNSYYYIGNIYYYEDEYELSKSNYQHYINNTDENSLYFNEAKHKIELIENYYFLIENPVFFNPELLQGVCSEADEFLPLVSPDGEFFFYTRRYKNEENLFVTSDYIEEFTFSTRITPIDSCDEIYTKGEPMPPPFNDGRLQGGATITIDNNLMFITICENERSYYTSYKNCDLFYTMHDNGEWIPLKRLNNEINSNKTFEGQPSITTEGDIVYFASNREGGFGGFDLYKIEKKEDGQWSEPINLGAEINTIGDEKTPYIHTDNQTLYFASDGHGGIGGFDIFVSYLTSNNSWTKPENIGYPINTEADEVAFIVSANGEKIYFSSLNTENGTGWDIYKVDLPNNVRPSKVLLLTGDITNETGKPVKNATVELTNTHTFEAKEGIVDNETGKYAVSTVVNDDDSFILTVNSEGTFFDTYYIDPFDEIYNPPTEMDIQVHTIEKELPVELRTVNFETNSADLDEASIICLQKLIKFLEVNSELIIEIHGHTDNIGNNEDNLLLSKKRAKAVRDYLIDNEIDRKRVSYKGFGEEKPITDNLTEVGRAENRRVEFIVVDE